LHGGIDPRVEEAWRQETRGRIAEIESGRVQGIPGDQVSAEIQDRRLVKPHTFHPQARKEYADAARDLADIWRLS
jgi:hypothetical protein